MYLNDGERDDRILTGLRAAVGISASERARIRKITRVVRTPAVAREDSGLDKFANANESCGVCRGRIIRRRDDSDSAVDIPPFVAIYFTKGRKGAVAESRARRN